MNTLHIDLGDRWRGGQKQALGLMLGLRARGHVAELVALAGSPLERRALAQGLRVHAAGGVVARLQAAFTLKKLLGQGRFELVHSHDAHALTAAWLAGASGRVRHVASRRVAYPLSQNRLALLRYRRVDRIIAVSCFVKKSVVASGLPPGRVEVIYDGVELPRPPSADDRLQARRRWGSGEPGSGPLLGCVGYLLPEKGQEHLVRALPIIAARHPNARLILAGDGPCRARLENLARDLQVAAQVEFAGFVENVDEVYTALDAFIFPSLAEPLGSSLLAAMSYGLPAVAVAQGAVPEVIEDGQNGLLVSGPNPKAIAAAVVRLLDDAAFSTALGSAARQTIEQRFSLDHLVEKTIELYEHVFWS